MMKNCIQESSQTNFVIDSPSLPGVVHIQNGNIHPSENNQHGEGDVGAGHQNFLVTQIFGCMGC